MVRVVLSAVGLILSIAGLVIFIGLIIGVWMAKREADRQITIAVANAESATTAVSRVITLVREIINRAEVSLATARTEQNADVPPTSLPLLYQIMFQQAKRDLPGHVERARDVVGTASEAVVVINAALDVFIEKSEEGARLGVRQDDVRSAQDNLNQAAEELRKARAVLGASTPDANIRMTPEQYDAVSQSLTRARTVTDQFDQTLSTVRGRVQQARDSAQMWTLRVAVGVSLVSVLAALGQVFMARACWRGLRRSPAV